jgi:hypothetical protein
MIVTSFGEFLQPQTFKGHVKDVIGELARG